MCLLMQLFARHVSAIVLCRSDRMLFGGALQVSAVAESSQSLSSLAASIKASI
jgi:hypothetical protein